MKYFWRWNYRSSLCGSRRNRTYKEGVYNAKIIERLLTVKEQYQKLTVSFLAPTNLVPL
jgi:hypothetical protein